jgi:polyphosphate glucokinase
MACASATPTLTTAIGVDIGGTGIKGAHVDVGAGTFLADRVRLHTPAPATPDAIAGTVVSVLDQVEVEGPVGLTLPAVIRDGVVETAANIDQTWIGTNAVELFAHATGRPVAVVNDADAAGIAEMRFGAGRGQQGVVVVVTLGTGIGSALFSDGTLVPNTELGHLPLHHGDAEDWAAESIREREELSWKEYAHRLQTYLTLLEKLLWPQLIIIGGGVSRKAEKFLPRIKLRTTVVPARLHNDAGIVGAALFAPGSPPTTGR